jgi:hypothetical protein
MKTVQDFVNEVMELRGQFAEKEGVSDDLLTKAIILMAIVGFKVNDICREEAVQIFLEMWDGTSRIGGWNNERGDA